MGIGTGNKLPRKLAISCFAVLLMLLLLPCAEARPAPTAPAAIDGSRSEHLTLRGPLLRGPESVAFDGNGAGPYSGVSDGRILKWNGKALGWTTYAYGPGYNKKTCTASRLRPAELTESTCGRPLDAYKGLMRVGPGGGKATVLVNKADGVPLRFTNGVDVDQVTGEVYFTDSSMNYPRSQHERVTATGDSTGRLMKYDPQTNRVTVLQSGITYPNGLAVSADRTHLVISLTGPCKLLRYWIKGAKADTSEILTDLPGYPDNVRSDGKGGFWVALHREKSELPFGRDSHLLAVRIGADGKVTQVMKGPKSVRPTEVVEREGGKLYMGSVELPYVAVTSFLKECAGSASSILSSGYSLALTSPAKLERVSVEHNALRIRLY
ncbi:hypothetical protein EJB05_33238 [Eragrostis curvula]|uniref:Strictosidine synthase conserved region domain-containing protein n=1 Tax=Eragrostis curvula TaxID=38414 RepID=A0A5J9U0M9_9POAL|nr:hypothetical protein EJB05_33238 [Eragrostis curvula]